MLDQDFEVDERRRLAALQAGLEILFSLESMLAEIEADNKGTTHTILTVALYYCVCVPLDEKWEKIVWIWRKAVQLFSGAGAGVQVRLARLLEAQLPPDDLDTLLQAPRAPRLSHPLTQSTNHQQPPPAWRHVPVCVCVCACACTLQ